MAAKTQKKPKKPRAGHRIGKGYKKPEKDLQGTIYRNCVRYCEGDYKKKLGTAKSLYEFLTGGMSVSSAKTQAGKISKGEEIPEKKTPGPPKSRFDVDSRFAGFYDWVVDKMKAAKKGGFLTIRKLRGALKAEKNVAVSLTVLRRTLKKLGFTYVARKGKWESRRHEPHIQKRLKAFVEWAVKNSTREEVPGQPGKYQYYWNFPVAFQDESFLYECVFRHRSWCNKDRTYDKKKKGDGARVSLIHCIFTKSCDGLGPDGTQPLKPDGHPTALVAFKSTWTGKKHEFKGPTTTGEHIHKYFDTRVFPTIKGGGVVCVDNAGTHKVFLESLADWDADDLEAYILERLPTLSRKDKTDKNWKYRLVKDYEEFRLKAHPHQHPPKEYRKFIFQHHLQDTVLREKAKTWQATVNYLPQYYPECNPIERYWALLKRYYYDSDPTLPWTERLSTALEKIPKDYVEKCIQKSLSYVWQKKESLDIIDMLGSLEDNEAEEKEDEESDSDSQEEDGDSEEEDIFS